LESQPPEINQRITINFRGEPWTYALKGRLIFGYERENQHRRAVGIVLGLMILGSRPAKLGKSLEKSAARRTFADLFFV
jgi:hypothetical protein